MSLVDLGKRLLETAKRGDTDEVRALMSNGAPFTTDWLGTSPLHFAAQHGHLSTAEILLRAGISRDARTKVDRTPLHVAAQEGHLELVDLLVRNGADIDSKDMLKMTPLHWAVEKGHFDVISYLLKHNADINHLNKFDKSPLDIAMSNGRTDLMQVLQYESSAAADAILSHNEPSKIEEVMTSEITNIVPENCEGNVDDLGQDHDTSSRTDSDNEDNEDHSSTSVLATLAALAEVTAPHSNSISSTKAEDALNWLETHGITMISADDNQSIVSSAVECGQTLKLTEAGKLALKSMKSDDCIETSIITEDGEEQIITEEIIEESVITDDLDDNQRVITIVSNEMHPNTQVSYHHAENDDEPPAKKLHIDTKCSQSDIDLRKQLAEMHRKAEEYRKQLKQKAEEAEQYKAQLHSISSKNPYS